ncbi:SNF-related serine/threonine-protein kinase [Alligator mississippiensis]|uniref:SNF-related serine/threonine-protein kinase n=1 Tax=Alligator mississippiensis TaxID=8496 RepID=A0A151MY52_ALLMI|nr:SNF-related serine/threonine-protein kinase [Alligator mississippiensis]KYO29481.1 SNF-related serine/threonine-protein kinase [Alligator mississippiensis]
MAGTKCCYEGKIAGLYDLERTLGKGHFAVVKLARHVFTGEKVAVKVIDKSKLDVSAAGQLLQEVRCMKLVQHPNVVRLYEVIDTHSKLYLILELGDGGDMFDHIMRYEGGLTEGRAKHYFAQIVHAISYCHKLHVVHRDLKPENVVFFQEQGVVKLTDFGFSNCFQPGKMLTTSCGSLAYSAPEILLGDEYDAPAVDIWSLGVILYMLVCGHAPFQEANDSETLTMIMDCRYTIPPHVSSQCSDLISRMLQRDPKQRASLEQIETHPWLQGVDPSPASRSLLPLTSHKRVSEEEHDIIIQAMTCGNIADRDTIQEALEADRYNHITATYFLLAERILREKQEKQSHNLSLVYNLAQQVQNRTNLSDTFSTVGNSSDLSPFMETPSSLAAFPSPKPQPATKSTLEAFGKDSGKSERKSTSLSTVDGDEVPASFHGNKQPVRALLKPSLVDAPIAKSTPALQQICEEEEEEEEDGKPDTIERKSTSLNQEQMRDFQTSKVSILFCRGTMVYSKGDKGSPARATKPVLCEPATGSNDPYQPLQQSASPVDKKGPRQEAASQNAGWEVTGSNLNLGLGKNTSDPLLVGTTAGEGDGELWKGRHDFEPLGFEGKGLERAEVEDRSGKQEDNNNTTKIEDGGTIEELSEKAEKIIYPQSSKDLGTNSTGSCGVQDGGSLQAILTRTSALEDKSSKIDGIPEMGSSDQAKHSAESSYNDGTVGSETMVDNVIKLDPGKNKSASLRDRIMQFPLCEKALAFKIRPSSKDSLLSLGQFNCCHVI